MHDRWGEPGEALGFGVRASAWAARLHLIDPILVCEPGNAQAAWMEGVRLRRAGKRFLASVYLEDPRATALRARTADAGPRVRSVDELRLEIDDFALHQIEAAAAAVIPAEEKAALHEFLRLGHAVLVRSWAEAERLRALLGGLPREAHVCVAAEPGVPPARLAERSGIVVWGANERPLELAPFLTALQDLAMPVTIVAAAAPGAVDRVRFVLPADAEEVLAGARVIIDATDNDPAVAIALARHGRPLAVAATGGASEFLSGVAQYDAWNRRSILAAAQDLLNGSPPRRRAAALALPEPGLPRSPQRAAAQTPLVSIVMATYNRPALLDATLAAIERQTYPAIEVVVVNDAGIDVGPVIAAHRVARVVDAAENLGPAGARNLGLREARGEYITFFDDDDEMFPDHIASLVDALERSGLDVAYGQMVNALVTDDGHGGTAIGGFRAYEATFDHADIQWGGGLATTAILFRHALLATIGALDTRLVAAEDYDFWIRLAEARDWARVPYITSIYNWRGNGTNISDRTHGRHAVAHRQIYAKYPTQRTLVTLGRREISAVLARDPVAVETWPAWARRAFAENPPEDD